MDGRAVTRGVITRQASLGGMAVAEARHPPGFELPLHAHPIACATLVVEGTFEERVDGRTYRCREGDVLLKPPDAAHANRYGETGAVSFVLMFASRATSALSDEAGSLARVRLLRSAGAWLRGGDGVVVDSLGPRERAFLRSHEWHLLVIAPEARFRSPRARGQELFAGHPASVVRFLDPEGAPTDFFYREDTGLPLGFRVPAADEATAEVMVQFEDWRPVGGIRLPFGIRVDQGEQRFRFRVAGAAVEWMDDEAFGSGAAEESAR